MAKHERRKERRYVVEGVNVVVGKERYPVIDLSANAARLSCTVAQFRETNCPIKLEFCSDNKTTTFEIKSSVHRYTDLYVVVSYDPPTSEWDTYIRQFDTFHVDDLDTALFD